MVYSVTITSEDVAKADKKGSVWKEVLLSFIASLPFFTYGLETTELFASAHSGSFYPSEEVPWNATALIVGAGISAPIYCFLIDRFGRKVGIFIVSLTQGASCVPLFLPPTEINTYILHAVAGISTGGLFTVLPIYIYEINSVANRGFCLTLMMFMSTLGCLMKLAVDLEVMMYLMTAVVMVQFLTMLCLVESPVFYVKDGDYAIAAHKISKLKCLSDNNLNVTKELEILKSERERANANGRLTMISIFRNLIWRDASKIGFVLLTTTTLCGSIVFLDEDKTLMQLQMASDTNNTLVLVAMFLGSLLTVILVKFIEKRYLMTFGYIVMVMSMGILAVYTQADLTVTSLRWLPVVALAVLVFGYGVMWGLPGIVLVEMFNFEVRTSMIAMLFSYAQIIKLIHVHTFRYIEEYMGIYLLFYIFAAINLYGGVYALFTIPDLKNKTLKQIEKQLKRIPIL